MHGIMPIKSTERIERAILVVDTNVINPGAVCILAPIFGHDRIYRTIDRRDSSGDASEIMRLPLGALKLRRNSDDLLMSETTPVCRGCPAAQGWCAAPIASVGSTKPE
jgi:hypothetical protein